MKASAIYFDGPYSVEGRDGDEVPEWVVFAGDDDGDPVRGTYRFRTYDNALLLARRMSEESKLELVIDASARV